MSETDQNIVKRTPEAMIVANLYPPASAHGQRPRNVRSPAGLAAADDPLCRLSPLCGGTLPLLGSLIAFAALAAVAVMV